MMRSSSRSRFFWSLLAASAVVFFVYHRSAGNGSPDVVQFKQEASSSASARTAPAASRVRPLDTNEAIEKLQKIIDDIPAFVPSDDDIRRQVAGGFRSVDGNRTLVDVDINTSLDPALVEKVAFSYLKRLQITCPKQTRMGRQEDGGWNVCIAGPFNIAKPCLAYSIGMGGEWSFDNMITTTYGCQDMAYDPTIGKPDHKPNPLLWFYNTGLGKTDTVNDKNWKLRTFPTLLAENNHTTATIDILKIDIEYSEWESLEAILAKPSCLKNVKQLMIEYHTREMNQGQHSSVDDLVYYWHLARGLDRLGFKVWNVWENDVCNFDSTRTPGLKLCGCFNTYYVNTRIL